jgi:hypothetical protein
MAVDPNIAKLAYNVFLGGMIHDGFDPRGMSEEQIREEVKKQCLRCLRLGEKAVVLSVLDRT